MLGCAMYHVVPAVVADCDMFTPLQQLERGFSMTSHVLAGFQICAAVCACEFQSADHSAADDQTTGHKHEGEQWSCSGVESTAGGDVCVAAPELCRVSVSSGSADRAGRAAGQVGVSDAGAVRELQTAGRDPSC